MTKVNDRVGAVCSANKTTVRLFGYGVYLGDEVPPPEVKLFGVSLAELKHKNPKIRLDNGKVVWGCECWWGGEETVQRSIGGRDVVLVDIEEERKCNSEG